MCRSGKTTGKKEVSPSIGRTWICLTKVNFPTARYGREEQRETHAARSSEPAVQVRKSIWEQRKADISWPHRDKKKTSWRPEDTVQYLLQLINSLKCLKPSLEASTKLVKKLFIALLLNLFFWPNHFEFCLCERLSKYSVIELCFYV